MPPSVSMTCNYSVNFYPGRYQSNRDVTGWDWTNPPRVLNHIPGDWPCIRGDPALPCRVQTLAERWPGVARRRASAQPASGSRTDLDVPAWLPQLLLQFWISGILLERLLQHVQSVGRLDDLHHGVGHLHPRRLYLRIQLLHIGRRLLKIVYADIL